METERQLTDRIRKARYAIMMNLDWLSHTTSEESDRVKNTLQKALDILDGKDEQGQ